MPALLGHHFLIGLRPTPDLHPDDKRLLETLRPAGVIAFRANFDSRAPYEQWHARFAQLVADARAAIGRDRALVCIDHEGGTVLRPPAPITPFAFARQWADRSAEVGAAMAVELSSLGVNLSFAPVVDIDSNPANPVIGPRAFGTTADQVIAAARPYIAALQANGVLACPKHFPGHGDTSVDSHVGLPVLDVDRDSLAARELRPFAAVLDDVQLVMTAHILFPRIDPSGPATLSHTIIDQILRRELGYRNAVVTDDIGMGAVSALFDQPGAAARAVASGTDMIMICSHWSSTDRAYALHDDLQRAALPDEILAASRARIDRLLAAAPTHVPQLLPPETFAAHAQLAPLRARPGAVGQTVSLKEA